MAGRLLTLDSESDHLLRALPRNMPSGGRRCTGSEAEASKRREASGQQPRSGDIAYTPLPEAVQAFEFAGLRTPRLTKIPSPGVRYTVRVMFAERLSGLGVGGITSLLQFHKQHHVLLL